jgi:hypothetical protein
MVRAWCINCNLQKDSSGANNNGRSCYLHHSLFCLEFPFLQQFLKSFDQTKQGRKFGMFSHLISIGSTRTNRQEDFHRPMIIGVQCSFFYWLWYRTRAGLMLVMIARGAPYQRKSLSIFDKDFDGESVYNAFVLKRCRPEKMRCIGRSTSEAYIGDKACRCLTARLVNSMVAVY